MLIKGCEVTCSPTIYTIMTNEEKAQEICEKHRRYNPPCSSLECYLSAIEMAEWKEQQMIEKAFKWLDKHFDVNIYEEIGGRKSAEILTYDFKSIDDMIDDFKKYMEE